MARAQADRRLMAILSTDVAGCTALRERDEGTAIRVRERHRALIRAPASQFERELGFISSMTPGRRSRTADRRADARHPWRPRCGDVDFGIRRASLIPGARLEILQAANHAGVRWKTRV